MHKALYWFNGDYFYFYSIPRLNQLGNFHKCRNRLGLFEVLISDWRYFRKIVHIRENTRRDVWQIDRSLTSFFP